MLDLIIRGANLPDGRQGIDIGIQSGKIARVEPALKATAGQEIDAQGQVGQPAFRRCAFPHGRDPVARPAAPQPVRHTAGRHRAVGRAEAAADPGGDRRARAGLLRLGGGQGAAGDPLARRRLRSAPAGGRCAAGGEEEGQTVPRPAAGRVPAGWRAALARRDGAVEGSARSRRRRGRRHPAFRAHHGGRRGLGARAVRDRGGARPAGRHALRRDR